MYLRTIQEAKDALAAILEMPDRRDQIIRSTVQIMLCLEVEPRGFLMDCQDLLVHDGLEALRRRRREALVEAEPLVVLDPEEDRLFESVAASLDALRFADAVRQVFPELREERWRIARAILVNEGGVRAFVESAVRSRGDAGRIAASETAVREMVVSLHRSWMDRSGSLRAACLGALRASGRGDPDRLHPEAEELFELFATSDERATGLLDAIDRDPDGVAPQVERLRDVARAVRSLEPDAPQGPPGLREVA
ncbi:MAG TPA: hypothetical protein VEN81_07380 [Planctomycetota bacterium]|nr:hypothetical protein [Planctomycetota bacterium]